LTSEEKWSYVISELEKLRDLESRLEKLEKSSAMQIRPKPGGGHTKLYTGDPSDEGRPTAEEIEARWK